MRWHGTVGAYGLARSALPTARGPEPSLRAKAPYVVTLPCFARARARARGELARGFAAAAAAHPGNGHRRLVDFNLEIGSA